MGTTKDIDEKDTGAHTLAASAQQQPERELQPGEPRKGKVITFGFPTPFALLRKLFDDMANIAAPDVPPRIDVEKRDEDVLVQVDLPNVDPTDVRVSIEDDILVLEGKAKEPYAGDCACGRFRRVVHLPAHVDPETARAALEEGVLEVRVGRLDTDKGRARQIEIEHKQPTAH
ncbi:MAG: Hsp20/alpha crystallin family protein [Deltaproteobacteria bacterium]|nr:Hsp20/alpha crystallin family protein [Deltaproteobacteria bacterium]MCW5802448.1 Hsp20/alpha crystallin family protein [Deltaproteobacteria bacterium]